MHTDNKLQPHRDEGDDGGGLRARVAGVASRLRARLGRTLELFRDAGRRRDAAGDDESDEGNKGRTDRHAADPPATRPGNGSAAQQEARLRVSGEREEAYVESDVWEEVEP